MAYTEKERDAFIKELSNPEAVVIVCDEHGYAGDVRVPPTSGCKTCWMVYFFVQYARTPPHLREQRLAELQSIVKALTHDVEHGKVDFELYNNPIVRFKKGQN